MNDHNSIALMAALSLAMRSGGRTRRAVMRTPEQIAAADKRMERQQWNAVIEQRKADKLAAKGKA